MAKRIGSFIIFALLTFITIGIYPIYFYFTRTKERNELLAEILAELKSQPKA